MSDNYGRNPEPPEEQPTQRYDASPEGGYAPNYDPNPPLDQPTQVQPSYDQAPLDSTTQAQPSYMPPPYTNQPTYGGQLPPDVPPQVTPNYAPPPYTNQPNYAPDYNQPPQTYSQPSQTYSSVEVQQGGSNVGMIVAGVVGLLVILGLGAYFLLFNKPSNNTVVVVATPTSAVAIARATPTLAALASPTAVQIATAAAAQIPTAGTVNLAVPPVIATPMARTTPSPGPLLVDVDNGVATKEMIVYTSRGEIDIDLYPNAAPQSIAVYENMANSGQYDNHTFHRIEDWVLQGNDPRGDGTGGGDITTELNKIPYQIGSVGIARAQLEYSNNSQFFIVKTADLNTYENFTFLNTTFDAQGKPNGGYTLIGQVTKGMNLVDAMQIGDKIISIRVRDKAGVSQTTPSGAATSTTTVSSEQQAAAQLLSAAAANMGQLTSYSYTDSTTITGTGSVDTYILAGATDRSKQTAQYNLLHSSNGGSSNNTSFSYNVIQVDGKEYYSSDSGATWQVADSDLLSSANYYFSKVSSDISPKPEAFAAAISNIRDENEGGGKLRHLSVDAAKLYGDKGVGINGEVDIWLDPVAKTITELHLRGTASGSTAQITYQGKWSKFNVSPLNVTRPTNIVTPQATGEVATPAPGKSTVTIGMPIGGGTQLAQQLIDTAKKMQGFKSFHYTDTAQQGTTTYALDGDVDVAGDKASFRYDSAGTIFQLIAIGQTEYYSADDGKTWQVNTNQPILGSVNYYLKQLWPDIANLDAAKLAPFIDQLNDVTDTKKIHISLPAEAIYGDNTGGIKGRMEFWLTGDKTVSQIYVSGDYNGQAVTYQGMWTAFNKQVNISAPTNVITPTPLNGDDTGGNSGGLKLGDFAALKSFQASYSVVLTADKQVSTLNYTINVVRPDRMNLDVRGQANGKDSSSKEVVIGDDLYTNVAGSGWTKQAGGKKEYAKYEAMLNNELVGLPALSASFISAGEQTIVGEPCTHYIYSSGSLNLEIWVAKSDRQVRQLFDHAANTEVQITLSKLNGVGDINAPSGVK